MVIFSTQYLGLKQSQMKIPRFEKRRNDDVKFRSKVFNKKCPDIQQELPSPKWSRLRNKIHRSPSSRTRSLVEQVWACWKIFPFF